MKRRAFLEKIGIGVVGSALLHGCVKSAKVTPSTVRFGLLTDLHYADKNTVGTRFYRDSISKCNDCINAYNASNLDFVVELGDLKDFNDGENDAQIVSHLQAIEAVIQQFNGPTYYVLGNHDLDNLSKAQFLENITNTGIAPASNYYSFDVKGVHFVVLDANYNSDGSDYDHNNFDWTDVNIPQAQLDWLAADLAAVNVRSPAIVFVHQLLDGAGSYYVNNAPAVRTVLENSGKVVAVFQGHHHPGQYNLINGIHYYTTKAMVEGAYPANNAFAVVEIVPGDRIVIDGSVNIADKTLGL